ncbi:MGH1-like glycoside hydrolase domain-containing protein [Pelagibacterium halotolerans]|uniref:MGH1-like glycoside hydrolase domain-containing protein n=1 Tax=Pelagibacterium halotolerans TaxID=531813 RepID=UPI00384D09BD
MMNTPSAERADELDARAREILTQNDRGGYTVPTKGLYPFQWNWDSALVALGFATFDTERAWTEIETLFKAQWDDGMVPHIVFWQDDAGYFPGHDQWGSETSPPTSGITQPPVAATIVRALFERDPDVARAANLVEKLARWHVWFARARDPQGRGLVAITHPWESGRDNLPDWDAPLSYVDTSRVGDYQRRDTQHVHADQRPLKAEYDKYMALVQFGREAKWDIDTIAQGNPFWVADIGVNAILLRAERDLAALAAAVGETDIAESARVRAARMEAGIEALWSEELNGYVSLDLRHDAKATTLSAGTLLALYGGVGAGRAEQLTATLARWAERVTYLVPSYDPEESRFDPIRYWRGPVWAVVNWMIASGLADAGKGDLAEVVRRDTGRLIAKSGFYESFDPLTGAGCGGGDFSWTAAMWLAWASPNMPGAHEEG